MPAFGDPSNDPNYKAMPGDHARDSTRGGKIGENITPTPRPTGKQYDDLDRLLRNADRSRQNDGKNKTAPKPEPTGSANPRTERASTLSPSEKYRQFSVNEIKSRELPPHAQGNRINNKHMPDTPPCPYCGSHGPQLRVQMKAVEEDSITAAMTKKIMSVIFMGLALLGCAFIGEHVAMGEHRAEQARQELKQIEQRAARGDPVNP